jgi:hypothetical protein
MPNHCSNILTVSNSSLDIIIQNYIKENEHGENYIDFESIIAIGDVPDWYEQRTDKWGTKWNGYDIFICEEFIEFYTAWSPPVGIIKRLAELHKDITFRLEYHEGGIGFRGIATAKWQDDEVQFDDQCWDMTEKDLEELGFIEPEITKTWIHFIDTNYQTLFYIEDGQEIEIKYSDGTVIRHLCKFIDEYHTKIGGKVYHICEFAQNMELYGNTYSPVLEQEVA